MPIPLLNRLKAGLWGAWNRVLLRQKLAMVLIAGLLLADASKQ